MKEMTVQNLSTFYDVGYEDALMAISGQMLPTALSASEANAPAADVPRIFTSSQAFWRTALADGLRGLDRITLDNVMLTEWFPRSPGLYLTREARISRDGARDYPMELTEAQRQAFLRSSPLEERVYNLYGKLRMVRGGVGCLRLARRETTSGPLWFMSATSQGRVEQGVPVGLNDSQYVNVTDEIRQSGVYTCTMTGQLMFAPPELLDLYGGYRGVPRFFLRVDTIAPRPRISAPIPVAGASVLFVPQRGLPTLCASYVDFRLGAGMQSLETRLPFLEQYVELHAGVIATDFDEQYGRFDAAVFSLKKISSLTLRQAEIDLVTGLAGMRQEDVSRMLLDQATIGVVINNYHQEVTMGDEFHNIGAGVTIINRSIVANAMNATRQRDGDEVARTLEELMQVVENSGDAEAIENANGLAEELQKAEPSKARIRTWLSAIGGALPGVAALVTAVAKLSEGLLN